MKSPTTTDEFQEALPFIASLISKSDKALQKLDPDTWQHRMLSDNLNALRIAIELLSNKSADANAFAQEDLQDAIRAFTSIISRTTKACKNFTLGSAQHTLLQNRLRALKTAQALMKKELHMKLKPHTVYHKDGSVWAVGHLKDGATTGYWEWFRKDGTKSRSGHFDNGHQVGEWITYDKAGKPHKITKMKPKDTSVKIAFMGCSE